MFSSVIYAAEVGTAAKPGVTGGSLTTTIAVLAVWGAVFYFFLIRPQGKRRKQHQSMMGDIKVGDEIITSSGIKGEVMGTTDEFFEVKVDKGVKLTIKKNAIASIYKSK